LQPECGEVTDGLRDEVLLGQAGFQMQVDLEAAIRGISRMSREMCSSERRRPAPEATGSGGSGRRTHTFRTANSEQIETYRIAEMETL
jgi:hypothetical protein